jgi:hypothetical protein
VVVKGRAESLRLEKADFVPLVVGLKKEDRELSLRLQPAAYQVALATDPPGAEVFFDGQSRGRTPLHLEVPGEGSHQIWLQLDGFMPWTGSPERHKALPDPIRLQKVRGKKANEPDGKVKKFFKGLFQK